MGSMQSELERSLRIRRWAKSTVYLVPGIAIVALFYVPLAAVFVFSFWEQSGLWMEPGFTLDAYETLYTNRSNLISSVRLGILSGLFAVIFAFPVAYFATFVASDDQRKALLGVFAIPFFISPLIRTIMLIPVLGRNGLVNDVLLGIGIVGEPVRFLLFTEVGVLIGTITSFMPFIVFTGWLSMSMIDEELVLAASDLKARPLTVVRTVVVPLAIPGLLIGILFVIATSMGESIFPLVLGGTNAVSIGVMTQRAFTHLDVPLVSAITVVAVSMYVVSLVLISRYFDLTRLFETFE